MDQLLNEFLGETEDLIEALADDVQALRVSRHDGRARRELVARIFRHAHTLKGSSSSFEQTAIAELTHEFENLLDSLRSGRSMLDDSVLDIFEESIASVSQLLVEVAAGREPIVPGPLVERLRSLAHATDIGPASAVTGERTIAELPDDITHTLSREEAHRLNEALSEGAGAFSIEIKFELATFDTQFKQLSDVLNRSGEIISTQPGVDASLIEQIAFRIVYATERNASQILGMLAYAGPIQLLELAAPTAKEGALIAGSMDPDGESDSPIETIATPLTSRVRIDISEIDDLLVATSALFKETMDALNGAGPLGNQTESGVAGSNISDEQIRQGFEDLLRRLAELKTVPIRRTLERAVRGGTNAARETKKEIDFEIYCGEIRLEKIISDTIADPLLHLLRNAVDHGIESSTERAAAGKRIPGVVKLEAQIDGRQLRLRIIDDGRGVDPVNISRVARDRGLLSGEREVSLKECHRIIFEPAFSTAESVSALSGRGVGLDVVRRAIEDVGGKIMVQSEVGKGSTFELFLPLVGTTGAS